jgi:hypothetical protein
MQLWSQQASATMNPGSGHPSPRPAGDVYDDPIWSARARDGQISVTAADDADGADANAAFRGVTTGRDRDLFPTAHAALGGAPKFSAKKASVRLQARSAAALL